MVRHLFIVAREHEGLYGYLVERFSDDPNVQIILDRRGHGMAAAARDSKLMPSPDLRKPGRGEFEGRSHLIVTLRDRLQLVLGGRKRKAAARQLAPRELGELASPRESVAPSAR